MNYYEITQLLKDTFDGLGRTSVVTMGETDTIDLKRTEIFPLAHIAPQPAGRAERTIDWVFTITLCDIIDTNDEFIRDQPEPFFGRNNTQDVIAESFLTAETFIDTLNRGSVAQQNNVRASASTTLTPFADRFNNHLAGVEFTLTIQTPNSSVANGIC